MLSYKLYKINNEKYVIQYFDNSKTMSFMELLLKLKNNRKNIEIFNNSIKKLPSKNISEGYFLESPIITKNNNIPAFLVFIKQEFPDQSGNYSRYKEYVNKNKYVFKSLSKINVLVIPKPDKNYKKYSHLKSFVTNANKTSIYNFWNRVVKESLKFIKDKDNDKMYLKTHGLAVNYFHFRIQPNTKLYVENKLKTTKSSLKLLNNINK